MNMGNRSRGFLSRSRGFLSKAPREKGMPPVNRFVQEFNVGDKVVIDVEPSVRKGMPHKRYQGKVGIVAGKRGRAFIVDVKLGDKVKRLIVNPVHLKEHKE
jgi:large subunit ribosomal protein L21e